MPDVRGGRRDERNGGGALRVRETSYRADADPDAGKDHDDEEPDRDDAPVRELLERDAVWLKDGFGVRPEALAGGLERPGAGALGRVLTVDVHRLPPPAEAVRDVERPEPARVVDHLGALAAGRDRVRGRHAAAYRRGQDEHRSEPDEPATGLPPTLHAERAAERERDHENDDRSADECEHAEDTPVRDALGVRCEIL